MKRSTKPLRRSPLKAKGKKGSRFPARRNRAYTAFIAGLPCLVRAKGIGSGCWHPQELRAVGRYSDPAHVNKTRGAGAGDEGEVVPLCRKHHREQEGQTAVFNGKYDLDLAQTAMDLWNQYQAEFPTTEAPRGENPK